MPQIPPQMIERPYRVIDTRMISDIDLELTVEPIDPANRIQNPSAGQWVYLGIPNPDKTLWARSAYSIVNPPDDCVRTGRIVFAIRKSGDFTQRVFALTKDDHVIIQGPFGVFTPKAEDAGRVFIAGGIGISPLHCMILDMDESGIIPSALLYSAKNPKELPYHERFLERAKQDPSFSYHPTCTRINSQEDAWDGAIGRINQKTIEESVTNPKGASYYICGPKKFLEEISETLRTMGVEKPYIHIERFD